MEKEEIAIKYLGHPGALISWSKSGYQDRNPNNLVVFNSNVCTKQEKIWFGDLDATKSYQNLIGLAKELGETIYVLYEMDGRFGNEEKPLIDRYTVKFDRDGKFEVGKNLKQYFPNFPSLV